MLLQSPQEKVTLRKFLHFTFCLELSEVQVCLDDFILFRRVVREKLQWKKSIHYVFDLTHVEVRQGIPWDWVSWDRTSVWETEHWGDRPVTQDKQVNSVASLASRDDHLEQTRLLDTRVAAFRLFSLTWFNTKRNVLSEGRTPLCSLTRHMTHGRRGDELQRSQLICNSNDYCS